jgi:hypothetical protein
MWFRFFALKAGLGFDLKQGYFMGQEEWIDK